MTIIDKREHDLIPYSEIARYVRLSDIPITGSGDPGQLLGLTVTDTSVPTMALGYYVGATWIKPGEAVLRVSPKFDDVDWVKMFTDCFYDADDEIQERLSDIYHIDFDLPKIEYGGTRCLLTPFIIAHFTHLVANIIRKGLKKDYHIRKDNLTSKLKGKLIFADHIRQNVCRRRQERNFCRYQDYSENCVENMIIKRALRFAKGFIDNNPSTFSLTQHNLVVEELDAFDRISDITSTECIKTVHVNPVYRDYTRTLKVAKLIIKRFGNDMRHPTAFADILVPPFWINMPLLFELYVLGKLRKRYGCGIKYHTRSKGNEIDFGKQSEQLIIDTKYTDKWTDSTVHDNVRQLAGYARNKNIRMKLGIYDDTTVMNCMIAYPDRHGISSFTRHNILEENSVGNIAEYIKFYKIGISLPQINTSVQGDK